MTFAETEKTELKQKLTDTLVKEIVAFLNTDGGTIYIGVDDRGQICGIDKLDESLKKTADIIESQILPDARHYVELGTKYIDHKHIIEIKVNKGDSLYYIKKYGRSAQGCYIRMGSTCRSMTEQQIEITHNKYLDSKVRITEIVGTIKQPTFQYLKLLLTEKGFTINDKTFAENFHLLTKNGKYNKMADLLADSNEVSIKVVRFRGKNKGDGIATRNEYGEKCLVVAMKQAFDYCADVINETRTSFSRGVRINTPLFDRNAFREVWFNACLHNNWADGTPPAIYIYTNRMEIISTGGLPANLSKEDFFRGVSKPVNEELAKLFIRLDLMEQTGYGIPRVTQQYGQKIFEFLDFFLRVTIPFEFEIEADVEQNKANEPINDYNEPAKGNNEPVNIYNEPVNVYNEPVKKSNEPQNDYNEPQNGCNEPAKNNNEPQNGCNEPASNNTEPVKIQEKLNETENLVYSVIATSQHISKEKIAQKIGKSRATITRTLSKMIKKGIIQRIGSDKNGYWQIVNTIRQ
ncbi:MAG: putative DNA binding domain-containing protein [Bacteroidales bacterium]|nr:putative DNA binding domain-containing protein [Bacteroidales bacterium]